MKNRRGFVSNSSTTSFCIYGAYLESSDEISLLSCIKRAGFDEFISKIDKILKDEKHWWTKTYKAQLEMLKRIKDLDEDETRIVEDFLQDHVEKFLELCLGDSFSMHYGPEGEGRYIGRNWSEIRDNETGAQFKETIEESLKTFFGAEFKCGTYEEAWRDG